MGTIDKDKIKIWIESADTNPASVSDPIKGEISDFDKSGGEREVEFDPVIGGYSKRKQATTEHTVEFSLIFDQDLMHRWDELRYKADGQELIEGDVEDKIIYIQYGEGATAHSYAYNNCHTVNLEHSFAADSTVEGTINFTFPPTTPVGATNFKKVRGEISNISNWDET